MSPGPLPEYVDAYQVFAHGGSISASVSVSKLQRFSQYLCSDTSPDTDDVFGVELDFYRDVSGNRCVAGRLRGNATLECQRCLQPLGHSIDVAFELIVVSSDQAARELDDEREVIITQMREDHAVIELLPLVEDELILGLPSVPRHADGECRAQNTGTAAAAEASDEPSRGIAGDDSEMHAKLAALKASLAGEKASDPDSGEE